MNKDRGKLKYFCIAYPENRSLLRRIDFEIRDFLFETFRDLDRNERASDLTDDD